MQATLIVECACQDAVGRVHMDTADLSSPGDWERIRHLVWRLLDAHRRGYCPVYRPTGVKPEPGPPR